MSASPAPSPAPSVPSRPADVLFVRDPAAARSLLDPMRRAILDRLQKPGSSSSVAQALELPRQRVNYHVRELEEAGLVRHVEDRRRGNCVERVVQAVARRHLVDPGLLDPGLSGPGSGESPGDPYSSSALLASAARTLATVGALEEEARAEGRRLPALCLETRIRFRTPQHEQEFARILSRVLRRLQSRFDDRAAEGGRGYRITLGGHPETRGPVGLRNAAPRGGEA